jgi:hypothetical protein
VVNVSPHGKCARRDVYEIQVRKLLLVIGVVQTPGLSADVWMEEQASGNEQESGPPAYAYMIVFHWLSGLLYTDQMYKVLPQQDKAIFLIYYCILLNSTCQSPGLAHVYIRILHLTHVLRHHYYHPLIIWSIFNNLFPFLNTFYRSVFTYFDSWTRKTTPAIINGYTAPHHRYRLLWVLLR